MRPRTARRLVRGREHRADDRGVVERRPRVRHRDHAGEPAARGGAASGLDGLGFLVARLAQVHVQVDEPRRHARIRPRRARERRPHPRRATPRLRRSGRRRCARRRRAPPPCRSRVHRAPASFRQPEPPIRAACRAPPCGRRLRWSPVPSPHYSGPSATSAATSIPRFIGPGCITSASGFRRDARAAVNP